MAGRPGNPFIFGNRGQRNEVGQFLESTLLVANMELKMCRCVASNPYCAIRVSRLVFIFLRH
jgi:hypothetical protein